MCLIFADITDEKSFDGTDMWLREVSKNGGENLPVFLVGCKGDLKAKRKVQRDAAQQKANSKSFLGYHETSAKDRTGYIDLLNEIVQELVK